MPQRLTPAAESPAPIASPATAVIAPIPAAAPARGPVAALSSDETGEMALAALLGALGLAGVGAVAYAASRRRRRRAVLGETAAYEPATEAALPQTAPADVRPAQSVAAPTTSAPTVSYATQSSGDPVPLPSKLPETFEERDALLKALVAAKPDKANPFTSPRARARRAKLILQSLGRDFTSRKPRIDLSEYTNRWPALRGWHPATA